MKAHQLYYVLGLGQTGMSVVRYLQRNQQQCEVFDDKISPAGLAIFRAEFPHVKIHLHENPDLSLAHIAQVHEIIISPGVPFEHPIAQKARQLGIPIIGDIELFARENISPVVAITGTNGKSTVVTLVGEMAKMAGFNVLVGGNIGTPVLDFLNNVDNKDPFDWVVLELSSFQLESTYSLHPKIACILNITEDHMDRYEDFQAYVTAKHRIYHGADEIVISADDFLTKPLSGEYKRMITFGLSSDNNTDNNTLKDWSIESQKGKKYLAYHQECWLYVDELKIKGTHNWSNALAALAMGKLMNLPKEAMCDVLRTFPGLEHRCQWVRELNQVNWYNDSKGTNVGATLSAINGFGGGLTGKIVLLLGGQSKGADFVNLCEPLKAHARAVILYGEDANIIEKMLKKSENFENIVPIIRKNTFEEVINTAYKEALLGDVVLLSPACASWDMFENFGHRGKVFTEMVLKLV